MILVIAAFGLGIISAVADGLFYLPVIGIVVFAAARVYLALHIRRLDRHPRMLR
ncbi:hypothetical protein [Streptomyces sp. NPDC058644]|uniref:hypothetical protein n=1 Tax=unclassified Streptomyces TaxID=2593676 RepID=UPI00364C2293